MRDSEKAKGSSKAADQLHGDVAADQHGEAIRRAETESAALAEEQLRPAL